MPSLSVTANYFWPTYPDRKVGKIFSPLVFSIFSTPAAAFISFFILRAALRVFVFVSKKRLIGRGERKAAPMEYVYFVTT